MIAYQVVTHMKKLLEQSGYVRNLFLYPNISSVLVQTGYGENGGTYARTV